MKTKSPDYVSTSEAAELLHCWPETIARLCAAGKIPAAIRVGRSWAIPRAALSRISLGRPGRPKKRV